MTTLSEAAPLPGGGAVSAIDDGIIYDGQGLVQPLMLCHSFQTVQLCPNYNTVLHTGGHLLPQAGGRSVVACCRCGKMQVFTGHDECVHVKSQLLILCRTIPLKCFGHISACCSCHGGS